LSGVKAIHCAAGAEEGSVKFTSKYSDDQNEISTSGDVEVPLKKLDQLVSLDTITLLKIDVEGFELFVLQGASETLARTEAVYFEAWDPLFAKHDYAYADVAAIFRASGFALYSVEGATLTPFNRKTSPAFTNLLALRSLEFVASRGFQIAA
jgi:Methyltransferase FkbM domain